MAFAAESMPVFGYGCAVFMQSDIVNFQRQGWRAEEILAGLAAVLPKNVFLYVASIPNLANAGLALRAAGRHAEQPGGRQGGGGLHPRELPRRRAAAGDHRSRALRRIGRHRRRPSKRMRLCEQRPARPRFIGLDAVRKIDYRTTRNEDTRCHFCKNDCLRTFIDVRTAPGGGDGASAPTELIAIGEPVQAAAPAPAASCSSGCGTSHHDDLHATKQPLTQIALSAGSTEFVKLPEPKFQDRKTKVPLYENEQRLIIATCEKGTVEDVEDMKGIKGEPRRDARPRIPTSSTSRLAKSSGSAT